MCAVAQKSGPMGKEGGGGALLLVVTGLLGGIVGVDHLLLHGVVEQGDDCAGGKSTRSRTGRGGSERRRLRQSLQRREAAGCDSLPEFISESDKCFVKHL